MKFSLVIPMYNESAILPKTLQILSKTAEECFKNEGKYEILFVDDGSTDGSAKMVEAYAATQDSHVRCIGYANNCGKGCAVRTGMLAARGEYILFTDCDLAYGARALDELYRYMLAAPQADAVIGSRTIHPLGYEGYTAMRRLASSLSFRILRLFGLRLSDSQSGLKGFHAAAARHIFSLCETNRFAFDFEVIMIGMALGYHFTSMPARVLENRTGGSVSLLRDGLHMLCDLFRIRRRVKKIQKTILSQKGEKTR